ncbi:MAG: dihydroneopterin aldolase [Pseudomonadota bacterium]
MDKIHVRDILMRCIVGVNADERREKQDVIINLCLHADLKKAGETDRIEDSVDYKSVKKKVISLVEGSSFFLVEALAHAIARACLEFKGVEKVDVRVEKPGALRFARTVGVEISRPGDGA